MTVLTPHLPTGYAQTPPPIFPRTSFTSYTAPIPIYPFYLTSTNSSMQTSSNGSAFTPASSRGSVLKTPESGLMEDESSVYSAGLMGYQYPTTPRTSRTVRKNKVPSLNESMDFGYNPDYVDSDVEFPDFDIKWVIWADWVRNRVFSSFWARNLNWYNLGPKNAFSVNLDQKFNFWRENPIFEPFLIWNLDFWPLHLLILRKLEQMPAYQEYLKDPVVHSRPVSPPLPDITALHPFHQFKRNQWNH